VGTEVVFWDLINQRVKDKFLKRHYILVYEEFLKLPIDEVLEKATAPSANSQYWESLRKLLNELMD